MAAQLILHHNDIVSDISQSETQIFLAAVV
jgi:hypothetical protein